MKDARGAALEEAGTPRMVGAGFAKKVTLFCSQAQHTAKTIFTKRRRHVNSRDNTAVGAMSRDKDTTAVTGDDEVADRRLSDMEDGKEEEMGASQDDKMEDEEGEALKHASNEVDRKWEKSITVLHEITSEHDEDSTTPASDGVDKDAGTIKILVQQALEEAFISGGDSNLKAFIRDSLKQVAEEYHISSPVSSNNSIAPVDKMKLVKEAMTEHQTLSRVLYVLALGTPITLLIARTVRGDYDRYPRKIMIRNLIVEMSLSFLAITVCHLYIIMFHFVCTKAPRLSMACTRVIIAFLCAIVSSWILLYTFYIPQDLFKPYFWWIVGSFLAVNWFLGVGLGCTGVLKEEKMIKV